MKWDKTTASKCRYGDVAGTIWGDWDILWEESESGYQGSARFFARNGDEVCYYEWDYGSCSGCDGWEAAGATDEKIADEMRRDAMWFKGVKDLESWAAMLLLAGAEKSSVLAYVIRKIRQGEITDP